MAYIGTPVQQALTKVTSQSFNGTGSQTVFTLNRAVNTGEELEVFVNNVQQEPGVGKSYTATGTTLTFDAAPSSGTGNIYVIYRGLAEVTRRLEHDPNAALAATTGTFSGDLLVGKSTSNYTTDGLEFRSDGQIFSSVGSDYTAYLNRKSTDGDILIFAKNAATVGSIGVEGGDLVLGTGTNCGIQFNDGNTAIRPFNMASNSPVDNAVSLGISTTRFKDLYLSGGVYLGGTGSANYLEDYEEGTWTASYTGGSTLSGGNQTCRYTKIGNLVQITGNIYYTSVSGGSGDLKVTGFPFTQSSGSVYYSTATIAAANWSSQAPVQANLVNTQLSLFYGGGTSPNSAIQVSNLVPYAEIYFSITYVTDS